MGFPWCDLFLFISAESSKNARKCDLMLLGLDDGVLLLVERSMSLVWLWFSGYNYFVKYMAMMRLLTSDCYGFRFLSGSERMATRWKQIFQFCLFVKFCKCLNKSFWCHSHECLRILDKKFPLKILMKRILRVSCGQFVIKSLYKVTLANAFETCTNKFRLNLEKSHFPPLQSIQILSTCKKHSWTENFPYQTLYFHRI